MKIIKSIKLIEIVTLIINKMYLTLQCSKISIIFVEPTQINFFDALNETLKTFLPSIFIFNEIFFSKIYVNIL